MPYIYVLGMDGKPQMPTKRRRHVQKLLDTGRARIAGHVPFTIQLRYKNDPVLQPVMLAVDPGRSNIGLAALSPKGELLFSAVAETRNKEIAKLMEKRRQHRRASRNGERKARQRLAKKCGTAIRAGMRMRKLPQYAADKFIACKIIQNTEARFCNRRRPEGWLTPTVEHLARTHTGLVRKIRKYLPVTDVAIEVNRFAFLSMEDPSASGVDFQNGPLKGFDDLNAAVRDLQAGKCLMCKKDISQYHHIVPRSRNGSNTIGNIAGLCDGCHERVHKDAGFAAELAEKKHGLDRKYGALSALNQAFPSICQRLEDGFGKLHVHYCTGRDTAMARRSLGIHKTREDQMHETDAWCIGMLALGRTPDKIPDFADTFRIMQFRRQDRAIVKSQTERAYKVGKETVAINRKKRTEQKADSLADWYNKQVLLHGKAEADRMRSQLTVKKSQRRYNNLSRVMPGTVFLYKGEMYVLKGQTSRGRYYHAVGDPKTNYPAAECRVVRHNEGLVFVG